MHVHVDRGANNCVIYAVVVFLSKKTPLFRQKIASQR